MGRVALSLHMLERYNGINKFANLDINYLNNMKGRKKLKEDTFSVSRSIRLLSCSAIHTRRDTVLSLSASIYLSCIYPFSSGPILKNKS